MPIRFRRRGFGTRGALPRHHRMFGQQRKSGRVLRNCGRCMGCILSQTVCGAASIRRACCRKGGRVVAEIGPLAEIACMCEHAKPHRKFDRVITRVFYHVPEHHTQTHLHSNRPHMRTSYCRQCWELTHDWWHTRHCAR